ncbi:MAG: DUF1592 domain-containing protein [Pirellulales bacterium]
MRLHSILTAAALGWLLAQASVDASDPRVDERHRAFFATHCVRCHGADVQEGSVRLDDLPFAIADIPTAERWQKVLNVLNADEMPPDDEPQPDDAALIGLLEHLSDTMVAARRTLGDAGGVIAMRRLNKREYENTLHDLLGVRIDAKDLPEDGGGGTFDTSGRSLFFSSDQFEQYLKIAREALDQVIATTPRPETRRVRIEVEDETNRRIAHIFRGYHMGGYRAYTQWMASQHAARAAAAGPDKDKAVGRPTTDFGIVDEAEIKFRRRNWDTDAPAFADYLTRPETRTGALLTLSEPNAQVGLGIPDEMPPGIYRVRCRIGRLPTADPSRSYVEIGFRGRALNDAMRLIDCRKVTGTLADPEVIEIEVPIGRLTVPLSEDIGPETKKRILIGERVIGFRERQHNSGGPSTARYRESLATTGFGVEPLLWVDWVEWEGPLLERWPTAAHEQIFFGGPAAEESEAYAREILARFAARAFRGAAVPPRYLDRLVGLFREHDAAGESFAQAIKEPLAVILASPSFLYMLEPVGTPAAARRSPMPLSPAELATRLSYLLWSGPPDEELLRVAAAGDLSKPTVLAAQVDRLLSSPRAGAFVAAFADQWLHMERLDFFQFNGRLYPDFDESVKEAARKEVFETIRAVLTDDMPLGTLLASDFVVVNDLLADYYGIPGVEGPEFRRVTVPADMPRGGFLGMAAVLAMGSDGERSSPVERGVWVLRKLLHDPPPPAPANVPQLSRHAGKLLSARELLAAHMEEPQCAQCHRQIDPIGFALEHFDATGRWREREVVRGAGSKTQEHDIDARGTLPDGTPFDGFFELRAAIAARQEAFARGLAENLIAYGLGRPYSLTDDALAASLVAASRQHNGSLRSMIQGLVASPAFQTK